MTWQVMKQRFLLADIVAVDRDAAQAADDLDAATQAADDAAMQNSWQAAQAADDAAAQAADVVLHQCGLVSGPSDNGAALSLVFVFDFIPMSSRIC